MSIPSPSSLMRLLRRAGISPDLAFSVVRDAQTQAETVRNRAAIHGNTKKAREALLAPLSSTIKSLQSAQSRWDANNRTLYASYLALLVRTREQIKEATAEAKSGQTDPIATVHARRVAQGLASEGPPSNWASWIKLSTKHKVERAFDVHYPIDYIGRKLVPFRNSAHSSASAKRWEALRGRLLVDRLNMAADPDNNADYIDCIDYALEQVALRETSAGAPVRWQHLLDTTHKELYEHWYTTLTDSPAAQPQPAAQLIVAGRTEELRVSLERAYKKRCSLASKRHKMRVYSADLRRKKGLNVHVTPAVLEQKYADAVTALTAQHESEMAMLAEQQALQQS